jgi:hypothetical protein
MSGETEASVSGWTVDTLHEHLLSTVNDVKREIDLVRNSFLQQHSDLREMLNERYAIQTKALDATFLAQQTAMRTALEAAEKAVQTALVSAEKAVAKAEVAAEKRFESVNEFRAQLTDQATTFLTRNEVDVRLNALSEKLDSEAKRNTTRVSDLELRIYATISDQDKRLTSRLDLLQGHTGGTTDSQTNFRLNAGTIIAIIAVIASFTAVIVNVVK